MINEHCIECGSEIDLKTLNEAGLVICSVCRTELVRDDTRALTYIDDMPCSEYLGG